MENQHLPDDIRWCLVASPSEMGTLRAEETVLPHLLSQSLYPARGCVLPSWPWDHWVWGDGIAAGWRLRSQARHDCEGF